MNYRERHVRSSLDRVQGKSPTSEGEIRAMAARALKDGVIVFLPADLAKLPWAEKGVIEGAAKRLYGQQRD